MSEDQGRALVNAGVAALDVGGAGGTSFSLVEAERAADRNLDRYHRLGQVLGDWGLPTAVSVVQCSGLGVPVIATGVCAGLDAAKALALGAGLVGIARPMLGAALEGYAALGGYLEELLDTLRIVLFLTGSRTPSDLLSRPRVVTGVTADWIEQLRRTGPPRPTGGATT